MYTLKFSIVDKSGGRKSIQVRVLLLLFVVFISNRFFELFCVYHYFYLLDLLLLVGSREKKKQYV